MVRTDQQRFDEALAYLKTIDIQLATEVKQHIGGRVLEAGRELSLEGHGYWRSGNDLQHTAVRALVLCQKAFLTPPYFKGFYIGFEHPKTKTFFHGKSEAIVKEAIKCYLPLRSASLPGMVAAAKMVNETSGNLDFYTLTRQSKNLGANPICFAAVRMWLFIAGFVSMRWLASAGFDLNANKANQMLGDGTPVTLDHINQIPAGHIFNFHAARDKATCHWGLSLGNGMAVASNTHQQILQSVKVDFTSGNSFYGQFKLEESYDVCKWKYALDADVNAYKDTRDPASIPPITIRDINPALVATYF